MTAEQIVDNPVPRRRFRGDLQGLHRGQSSAAFSEQIADPGGGPQDFLPVQGPAVSSSISPEHAGLRGFRTFSSPARWMNICPGTSAHPRWRLMRFIMLLVMTSGYRSGPMTNRTSGTVWSRRQYGACRLALGRPGCEFMKASSSTLRLRRCIIRCRARSDLSVVSRLTLGTAQVHGHGLVTPPVHGAVQWEFMALRTVYEMACFLVSFEGYVLVNMQYKFQLRTDDSGCALPSVHRQSWTFLSCFHSANCANDRRVFQVLLLDRLLTCPLLCNATCTVLGCQGRRHSCRGADADSLVLTVQKNKEILQLQSIEKVVDVTVGQIPRVLSV